MSLKMDEDIKRWTAKRKSALVVDIIQGKTTVAEASRAYDLSPSEIEKWVDDAKRGMENALRANPRNGPVITVLTTAC
jgi:transposase-like protein